jgi:hypothetical protein
MRRMSSIFRRIRRQHRYGFGIGSPTCGVTKWSRYWVVRLPITLEALVLKSMRDVPSLPAPEIEAKAEFVEIAENRRESEE